MNTLVSIIMALSLWIQVDLPTIRINFEKAEQSKVNTENLYNLLKDYNKSNHTIIAYKGASAALQARYESVAKKKKALFISGVTELEAAVAAAPENVEIRLIRFIIQENSPKILKYKVNLMEDKQMILAKFDAQSRPVRDVIKRYATTRSKLFSEAELLKLSN